MLGGYKECLEPLQVMVKYFCGTVEACAMMDSDHSSKGNHDWVKVAKATERAKRIIAQQFYVIGVLGECFCALLCSDLTHLSLFRTLSNLVGTV